MTPKAISLTDPQARWTAAPGGPAFFAYSTNYLIDTGVWCDLGCGATPAYRTAEVEITKTLLERVEAHLDLKPEKLIGDTAYGAAPMLAWLVGESRSRRMYPFGTSASVRTTPSQSVISRGKRKVMSTNARQVSRCVMGCATSPKPRTGITKANTVIYRASEAQCHSVR